jgi:predicted metal-dependent hydrolase
VVLIGIALVKEAWEYLPDRVAKLAREYGFKYNGFGLYNHCDHWGTLTSVDEIVLNIQLMRLPDHLIDYVILHEFAHIKESKHTPKYWKLLNSMCGNSEKLHRELEKYMKYIEEFGNNSWFLS